MRWIETKIEYAFIVKDGTHDSPKYIADGERYPLLTSKNLKTGKIDLSQVDFISKEDFIKINLRSKVDKGDLLFAMIGTIGNPVIVDVEPHFAIKNVALFKKRTDENSIEYLKYILSSDRIRKKLLKDSKGGTQKFVSLGYLRDFKIPLPPPTAQIRIATILSKAEALIAQRKESLRLLDELLKSTFLEMFGDPVRNEKEWQTDVLQSLVSEDCPLTYGIVQPGDEYIYGVPIVRPVDLTRTFIDRNGLKLIDPKISEQFKRTLLRGDEILMTVRGSVGVVALAKPELKGCNVTRGITPIWFSIVVNKLFIYHLFKTPHFQRIIESVTMGIALRQINLSALRKLRVINPPIDLQNQFAAIAEKVEALKAHYQTSLKELENLYGSLSQLAFKGELDLSRMDDELALLQ